MAALRRLIALALLLPLLAAAQPALAQTFPALSGRVVDAAGILPDEVEAALTARSKALEDSTGTQAVVATIPDLQGYPIEDYGYRLGRHWGIGQEGQNNGVILIVAPNERRVRIEVGYGLEPVITDGLSSTIVRNTILPKFREGRMADGVSDGFAAIVTQLELPPEEAAAKASAASAAEPSGEFPLGAIIFLGFFFFWIWLAFRSSRRAGRRAATGKRKSGIDPVVVWGPGMGGWGSGGGGWGSGGGGFGGGGFGGGGGGFGGGGASGGW